MLLTLVSLRTESTSWVVTSRPSAAALHMTSDAHSHKIPYVSRNKHLEKNWGRKWIKNNKINLLGGAPGPGAYRLPSEFGHYETAQKTTSEATKVDTKEWEAQFLIAFSKLTLQSDYQSVQERFIPSQWVLDSGLLTPYSNLCEGPSIMETKI